MPVPLFDTSTPRAPLRGELGAAIERVLDSERYILGPEVEAFEREFAHYCGTAHGVGVANGTDAITIALRAMGVGPVDEVVVPSFSFYASAEAVHLFGNLAPVAAIEELGVPVLEDAAQAAGSSSEAGRPGALGRAATF